MEALVDLMVTQGAERLGLDISSAVVSEARATAIEAIRAGFDVDEAYSFARRVMIQVADPTSVSATEAA